MVKDDFVTENGDLYYFDATGNQPNFVFVSDKASHWYYMRYFKATKGFSALFSFDAEFLDRSQSDYKTSVHNLNGQQYYFDTKTGIMVTNRYVYDDQGNWYYFGKDGRALHGFQTVDGNLHYFNDSGQQVKGDFLYYNNDIYYFDKDNGNPVTNQFVNRDDAWYYFEADGKAVSGFQTINGQNLCFHEYGVQTKGQLVTVDGKTYYFDPNTGDKWVNRSLTLNGTVYNFDNNGVVTTKADQTTHQNQFVKGTDQEWYYYDANGKKVTGFQTINKDLYYFNNKGANKFEEVFSTQVKTTTSPTKILVLSFVMPFITIHQLALMATSLKTSITLAMTVPSRQAGQKSTVTDTTLATILMTTPPKETFTQESSAHNSLVQMGNS